MVQDTVGLTSPNRSPNRPPLRRPPSRPVRSLVELPPVTKLESQLVKVLCTYAKAMPGNAVQNERLCVSNIISRPILNNSSL